MMLFIVIWAGIKVTVIPVTLHIQTAMANVRNQELKRAQLVALLKVQERVKSCDRDRYGKIAFKKQLKIPP